MPIPMYLGITTLAVTVHLGRVILALLRIAASLPLVAAVAIYDAAKTIYHVSTGRFFTDLDDIIG